MLFTVKKAILLRPSACYINQNEAIRFIYYCNVIRNATLRIVITIALEFSTILAHLDLRYTRSPDNRSTCLSTQHPLQFPHII